MVYLNDNAYFKSKNATAKLVGPPVYLKTLNFYISLASNDSVRFVG
jgi:hypothetical protein